jgi:hypothetical protein
MTNAPASRYFSRLAIKTFNRVGDIMIPSGEGFPAFSEYGGDEHLDKAAAYAPPEDIRALNFLMTFLAFAPSFFLRWLVSRAAASHQSSGPLTPAFKKLYYGWWGLIYGAYYNGRPGDAYSGSEPCDLIGFQVNRIID